jgi:hypothetical protein
MSTRVLRRGTIWAPAILSLALQACYSYARIDSQAAAPSGRYVELQITDRGRVGLGDRFGEGVRQISGTVVAQQANDLMLSVDRISNLDGELDRWSGDTTRIDRNFIGSMTERRFSPSRTTLLVVSAAGAIYVTMASGLLGSGRDHDDDGPTGPINQSNRIPRRPQLSRAFQLRLWRIFLP